MQNIKPSVQNLLQQLQRDLPAGVVAPSRWLSSLGISPQLARKYVANGWLVSLAYGAYARHGRTDSSLPVVDWQGVMLGLQRLEQQAVHVGGVSALNMQGLAHYLPLGGRDAYSVVAPCQDFQPGRVATLGCTSDGKRFCAPDFYSE